MNKIRFIISFFVLWPGMIWVSAQSDSTLLTFEDAYRIMQSENPSLRRAKKEVERKEYEKQSKQGLYMPKVSVGAQAVAMSDPLHLDLNPIGEALEGLYEYLGNYGVFDNVPYINPQTGQPVLNPATGQPIILDQTNSTAAIRNGFSETAEEIASHNWDQTIQEKTFATISANVAWPIFTGGKIMAANKAAGINLDISHEEVRLTEGQLLTEIVSRYYGLVLAMQASEVMQEKYIAMKNHFSDAQKKFDQGMIAKVELLNAKVGLSEAEREYKSADRMVATVRTGLSSTLASNSDTCFIPTNLLFINKDLPPLSFWIEQTYGSNPLLKQLNYKKELTTVKTNVSKGAYLPTVALMGTYHIADYQLSHYMPHWMVGAGISWNLFDGMSRNKDLKANKMLSEQVDLAREKANNELNAYITKLYNELNNLLQEISELENTQALAQEFCLSTEKAFKEGLKNSTDVSRAQSTLAQVKALRLKTFYNYDVTLATLLQVSGKPHTFNSYCAGSNTITESIK